MEDIRIRDIRDNLALYVNTAMTDGKCVGITRDGTIGLVTKWSNIWRRPLVDQPGTLSFG